jgi:o-succinylbenzoate---CoA ligase
LSQDRSIEKAPPREAILNQIYELCCQRLQSGWLVNFDGKVAIELAERKSREFAQQPLNFIAISTSDPIEFIATFIAGLRWGIPLFLCNPQWGIVEWEQVDMLTAKVDLDIHHDCIAIPTGGSSGRIKFAIHTWETLSAAVWGFQEFYEESEINCVCVLPLYHVSGLMQLMRSLLTGGKLLISDYHQLCQDCYIGNSIVPCDYFISLVPTQLHKLLPLAPQWLAEFKTILIGGAPPSLELLDRSRAAQLPLALTYGMTETASQITSLKPSEFLAGNNSCGKVLPHAEIRLELPETDRISTIKIAAKSLMLGYFPDLNTGKYFYPDDLGKIDDRGNLSIGGRNSDKIITGGENVFPIEVVEAIMATGLVLDTWVVGLPDPYWGQIVVAVYVEGDFSVSQQQLIEAIAGKLSKYKIPKHWLKVSQIPRNSLGKISIDAVELLARETYTRSNLSDS